MAATNLIAFIKNTYTSTFDAEDDGSAIATDLNTILSKRIDANTMTAECNQLMCDRFDTDDTSHFDPFVKKCVDHAISINQKSTTQPKFAALRVSSASASSAATSTTTTTSAAFSSKSIGIAPTPPSTSSAAGKSLLPILPITAVAGTSKTRAKKGDGGKREPNNFARWNGGIAYATSHKLLDDILFGPVNFQMPTDVKSATYALFNKEVQGTDGSIRPMSDYLCDFANLAGKTEETATLADMVSVMHAFIKAGYMQSHSMTINSAIFRLANDDLRKTVISVKETFPAS